MQSKALYPVLSHVVQYLPLRKIFTTLVLVSSKWAAARFSLKHIRIEHEDTPHIQVIVKHVNAACVVILEVYAKIGHEALHVVEHFKNSKCLLAATVQGADFTRCTSLEHIFVLCRGVPLGLPQSLINLTLCNALVCAFLPELLNLRSLGRTFLFGQEHVKVLNKLTISKACFEVLTCEEVANITTEAPYSFTLTTTTIKSLTSLQDCRHLPALVHVNLFLDVADYHHFQAIAELPNLQSLRLSGSFSWGNVLDNRSWPQLDTLLLAGVNLGILTSFCGAARLKTISFQGYTYPPRKRHLSCRVLEQLPQATSVYLVECSSRFIKHLELKKVTVLGIQSRTTTGSHALHHLKLNYNQKIFIRTTSRSNVGFLQWFLDRHSFSEVTIDIPTKHFDNEAEVVVPEGTTLILSNQLENKIVCHGRVHFIDRRRLAAFPDDDKTVSEFDQCVTKLKLL